MGLVILLLAPVCFLPHTSLVLQVFLCSYIFEPEKGLGIAKQVASSHHFEVHEG